MALMSGAAAVASGGDGSEKKCGGGSVEKNKWRASVSARLQFVEERFHKQRASVSARLQFVEERFHK